MLNGCVIVFVLICLFSSTVIVTSAQTSLPINQGTELSCPDVKSLNVQCGSDDDSEALTLAAAIIGGSFTVFLGPIMAQYLRKRSLYSVPYTEWCIRVHGTIFEFKELCKDIRDNPGYSHPTSRSGFSNPTYIIFHLWEMHKAVEEGYKWLGMIFNENSDVHNKFNDLFDDVDFLWHFLEDRYPNLLNRQKSSDDLKKILKSLSLLDKNLIARLIIDRITTGNFSEDVFEPINNFLLKKIPARPKPILIKIVDKISYLVGL